MITAGRRRTASGTGNSTSPAMTRLQTGASEPSNLVTFRNNEYPFNRGTPSTTSRSSTRQSGYPGETGFDLDDESDIGYASPAYSMAPPSGRGTPVGGRRAGAAQSMPPERDIPPGYERPRARTEDYNGEVMQQWRIQHGVVPPVPAPLYPHRPPPGRMSSNSSSISEMSQSIPVRAPLRTQASSSKLRNAYDGESTADLVARTSSAASGKSYSSTGSSTRMRSASVSAPYPAAPKPQPLPPMPSGYPHQPSESRALKRDSNSSNSTEHSSDFSVQQTGSPVTPYGSSDSSLAHSTLRHAMSSMTLSNNQSLNASTVKVKVHYNEDLFVIMVPRSTNYHELNDKVGKKIRLCGGRKEGIALRIKYRDEDGDDVSLGSNEDVQMAFETSRSTAGGQVTLFVS